MDHRAVRRHNLALVLRRIARGGPRSRARLARETGLNKTTVSSLAAELLDAGLLREHGGERTGRVGRPSLELALDGGGFVALGIELDADHVAVVALDLSGVLRHHAVVAEDNRGRSHEELVDRLSALAERALESVSLQRLRPVAITVAIPGLVDFERGHVAVAPNLGLHDAPLAQLVHERLGHRPFPIYVDNEANLGALAELTDGAGRGCRDFVYISSGVGIGAGMVIGGALYRGRRGFSGELGHLPVGREGPLCACGSRGCLEAIAGLAALLRRAGLAEASGAGNSVATIAARARAGDRRVVTALEEVGEALGLGCASLANLFNPRRIILGGYLAELTEWIVPPIEQTLRERFLARRFTRCELARSQLGRGAPAHGGSRLGLEELLEDPARLIAMSAAGNGGSPVAQPYPGRAEGDGSLDNNELA